MLKGGRDKDLVHLNLKFVVIDIIILILSFDSCKSGLPRLALATCGPVAFASFFL